MELLSHKIAHISGNVGPTLLQHPSNRSSLRPRPEKHIRGSLSCPWYTGEPEAPVLGVTDTWKLAQFGSRGPKMTKRQKVDIFGSVLSDFAVFPASRVKYEKNAAFGSHVALSVLQIDSISPGKSSYQSTTIGSPKPFPLLSPLILFPIFGSILGLEPLRGHQCDLLESIEGDLDPCRGHFSQKIWARG